MPGLTDNELTIDALNQAIKALNEINVGLPGGVDTTIIENNLALAAQKIDDVRVALETQSTAEIVGQNTNFQDLISAVGMLKLFCSQTVNITPQNYFNPLQPQSGPGGEGIPPPEPFIELDLFPEQIPDRKCWISNTIVDEMKSFCQRVDDWGLDEITNISFSSFFGLWVAFLGAWAVESVIFAEVAATVDPVLAVLAKEMLDNLGGVEASEIVTAIDARRDDLVCAIFDAPDVNTARSDAVDILNQEGVSAVTRTWFLAVMADFYLNYAFYQFSEQVEAAYELATGYDCMSCDDVCDNREGGTTTILFDDGDTYGLQAGQSGADPAYYASITFDATEAYQLCGGTVTISSCQLISGSLTGYGSFQVRFYDAPTAPNSVGNRYHSANLPTTDITGVRVVVFKSSVPFTVEFDWEAE